MKLSKAFLIGVALSGLCLVALVYTVRIDSNQGLFAQVATSSRTYYFDSVAGDDKNSGTSPDAPWKNISKLYSVTLVPGDKVLFKRADVFYGSFPIKSSGTSNEPILIGTYGSGAAPVISGLTPVTDWENIGGNIYEADCSKCANPLSLVLLNGTVQAMGRYPNRNASNGGYLTILSHSGTTSITDPALAGGIDWAGGEVAIRKNAWDIDRHLILSVQGSVLTYGNTVTPQLTTYEPLDRYGYFIQDHIKTLDQNGEWYFDPATKKLSMYFSGDPAASSVFASGSDSVITVSGQSNIVIDGIAVEGGNLRDIGIANASAITVRNSTLRSSGRDNLYANTSAALTFEANTIADALSNGINCFQCSNTKIINNSITRSGTVVGMGKSGNQSSVGINIVGSGNLVSQNTVTASGYAGIYFSGSSVRVERNLVDGFALIKDDVGGIYTFSANVETDQHIVGNLIKNGKGSDDGFPFNPKYPARASGIYLDANSSNIDVANNTAVYNTGAGLHLNGNHITISNNVFADNHTGIYIVHGSGHPESVIAHNRINDNTFLSSSAQPFITFIHVSNDENVDTFADFERNHYIRKTAGPFLVSDDTAVATDFSEWQKKVPNDTTSQSSIISNVRIETNDALTGKNISVNGSYRDAKGNDYTNSIPIGARSSVVFYPYTPSDPANPTPPDSDPDDTSDDSSSPASVIGTAYPVNTPIAGTVINTDQSLDTPVAGTVTITTVQTQAVPTKPTTSTTTPAKPSSTPTKPTAPASIPQPSTNTTITSIDYILDTATVHTATTFPDTFALDTNTLSNDWHTLSTVYHHADGATTESIKFFKVENTKTILEKLKDGTIRIWNSIRALVQGWF